MGIKETMLILRDKLKPLTTKQLDCIRKQQEGWIKRLGNEGYQKGNKKEFTAYVYYQFFDVIGDWFVARVFAAKSMCYDRRTKVKHNEPIEAVQRWYNTKTGQYKVLRRRVGMFGRDLDYRTELTEKSTTNNSYPYSYCYNDWNGIKGYRICGNKMHKKLKYSITLKELFDGEGEKTRILLHNLCKGSAFETLLKSKYSYMAYRNISLRVAKAALLMMRFKIELEQKDFHDWEDAIDLMQMTGIDWHNPKLLSDWKHQHTRAIKIKEKMDEKRKVKELEKEEMKFYNSHKKYLGIEFVESGLHFSTLNRVVDYFFEGKAMHHCVYQMGYYKKNDTIIFSIRDDNEDRLATLEYNITYGNIVQCRACCNKVPERYDDMIRIFSKHIKEEIDKRNRKPMEVAA